MTVRETLRVRALPLQKGRPRCFCLQGWEFHDTSFWNMVCARLLTSFRLWSPDIGKVWGMSDPAECVRVSVFYDVPDWAFHNIAQNIQSISSATYAVNTYGRDDWFGVPRKADAILAQSDVAVFLWRFDLLAFLDCLSDDGWAHLKKKPRCAFVVVVYDHIYADAHALEMHGNPFELADGIAASSQLLCRQYSDADHLPDIVHHVPDGVDLSRFSNSAPPPPVEVQPLRIGWAGNSKWGITLGHDFKGKQSVFDPAMDILRGADLPFTVHIADKAQRQLPREDMPDFYRGIDVLVCCSVFEGTPNPVLEAMASGCAIVSTDVGIVSQILGPKQKAFILPQRDPADLARSIEHLIREPETLLALKRENFERRASLDWHTRWPAWRNLFEEAIANADETLITTRALLSFRERKKSRIARMRKILATSKTAFRAYSLISLRFPGLIRWGKRILSENRK